MRRAKKAVFAVIPLFALLLSAEAVCRLKFFFLHEHDWNYITMPFKVAAFHTTEHFLPPRPAAPVVIGRTPPANAAPPPERGPSNPAPAHEEQRAAPEPPIDVAAPAPSIVTSAPASSRPVTDLVLGGSTVEENQPDEEMWTARLKTSLRRPSVTVVNAGQVALGSSGILTAYTNKVRLFKSDIVLYYEGWNEQVEYSQWKQVDRRIGAIRNGIHQVLFYRGSALYTYLVEKFAFKTTEAAKFWKIDVQRLRGNLKDLIDYVHNDRAELVFVTQIVRFPRMWKGIDTFDPDAVEKRLDELAADRTYAYDTYEISALNQRLAIFRSLEICQAQRVPVVNLLVETEALGDAARDALFMDMGHLTWKGDEFVGGLTATKLVPIVDRVASR